MAWLAELIMELEGEFLLAPFRAEPLPAISRAGSLMALSLDVQ